MTLFEKYGIMYNIVKGIQMLKFLNICDPHIGISAYGNLNLKTGVNSRIEDTVANLKKALSMAKDDSINFITILGDIFNLKTPSNIMRDMFTNAFEGILGEKDIYIIPGNHDSESLSHALSSLKILGAKNRIYIIDEPTVINRDNYNLVFLPWSKDYNLIEKIKEYSKLDNSLIFGHFTTSHSVLSNDFVLEVGEQTVPVELLEDSKFLSVFLGHIHKRQKLSDKKEIIHCGSLVKCNFGEINDGEKGVVLATIDNKTTTVKFIPIEDREFIQVDYKDIDKIDDKDSIVKVTGECTLEEKKDISILEIRNKLKDKCYKIYDIDITTKDVKTEVKDSDKFTPLLSEINALRLWCENNKLRDSVLKKAEEIINENIKS